MKLSPLSSSPDLLAAGCCFRPCQGGDGGRKWDSCHMPRLVDDKADLLPYEVFSGLFGGTQPWKCDSSPTPVEEADEAFYPGTRCFTPSIPHENFLSPK